VRHADEVKGAEWMRRSKENRREDEPSHIDRDRREIGKGQTCQASSESEAADRQDQPSQPLRQCNR
jgi:hypothetical protein